MGSTLGFLDIEFLKKVAFTIHAFFGIGQIFDSCPTVDWNENPKVKFAYRDKEAARELSFSTNTFNPTFGLKI